MKIYTYPKSRSLRVLWTLEEIGAPYESIKVDLFNPTSCIKFLHSRGKVPFLSDGDVSIEETLAICIYICEKYPSATFYPTEPKPRSIINSWLSYALTDLESPVWNLLKQQVFIPENQRNLGLIDYAKSEANRAVNQIRLNEGYEWITGPNFTLADIFVTHTLLWAKLCGIAISSEIKDYMDRAMSRPAYLKAQERNNR
ncbi:glutathione S-transferase family protein [Xenorhabdus griffiniae]|uniref:Glutathione S-transferase family protein n=1 Tax=Xenorhabdus griffiniae TaxID=351672 RepID=A0ABY9XMU8_9GAMM|nr:glutathione S-transferase family protein [Xenorhabdus griffiniae]MBD1227628.1 glutathione S-transferase family protein [Xenorhabdus griffiniae]MBE8586297.1 glutathione S-transferase family protein [Xenorhabdus griffiniae]WMV74268.1 glutathione S-transferase family protein [Xenorhabdus griffiniae]WNH03948.1 glutathione S-transferase family protein [Xenorhabdus griffiniae]